MESNLDLNAILKAAGASIIQRRPEHANLIEYQIQLRNSTNGWLFEGSFSYTFVQAKERLAHFEAKFPASTFRIVAIVEVK